MEREMHKLVIYTALYQESFPPLSPSFLSKWRKKEDKYSTSAQFEEWLLQGREHRWLLGEIN